MDYIDDSHVIRMGSAQATGTFFMPFGFDHPALIIDLEPMARKGAAWRVEWNRPLQSVKVVNSAGARLLRFDGIDEPLLLVPLGPAKKAD